MQRRKLLRFFIKATALSILVFLVLLHSIPLPEEKLYPQQAYRFYDTDNHLINLLISKDQYYRMHTAYEQLPELMIKTLLLHEDQYFFQHYGINPLAVVRAGFDNIVSGRIVSGASTITMQLARMLQRRDRTLAAKLIESFRAIQLEMRFSKEEILAHYFAIAPYGGNIEGVQAAAYRYFNKAVSELSIGEIALLVALPKSPNNYRPDRQPDKAIQARNRILDKMLSAKLINHSQYDRAYKEPIVLRSAKVANIIPHTAWHLRLSNDKKYDWHTTIDTNIQRRTQKLLQQYVNNLQQYNISNAAAVIIDNRNREIKAIVGSTDYYSQAALGANDGTRTPRSPGSTLKPFLYGLALDNGIISERTVLHDIPINYAGYSPQNYSKEFIGPVQAREALTESLNVVAVKLSNEMGMDKLYNLLKQGGITSLNHPSAYYGLPLVLGGVEIELLELTNLYASLANGGEYQAYRLLRNAPYQANKVRLLSKEAAWIVTHILTDVARPDFPSSWQYSKNRATIAWKTGTSYGHQDAWSIGYTPDYTIGVWVGNFDGTPSNGLVGSHMAAPILFDLFQAITPAHNNHKWFAKPEAVGIRRVCATCGTLATRHCQTFVDEYFIKNAKGPALTQRCNIPQAIVIDTRNGMQASADTPPAYRREKIFNIWPSHMASFLLKHGVPLRNAPPYRIDSMAGQQYYAPVILSPQNNTIYYKRTDQFTNQQHGIKLSAAVTNRVRKVFWFLNGEQIAHTDPLQDIIINPPPGTYQLLLVDEVGGRAEMELIIKDYRDLQQYARH